MRLLAVERRQRGVAQMVERLLRMHEAGGSIPPTSNYFFAISVLHEVQACGYSFCEREWRASVGVWEREGQQAGLGSGKSN